MPDVPSSPAIPGPEANPALPAFGPWWVLGLLALYLLFGVGLEVVLALGADLVLGAPPAPSRWLLLSLNELAMLGAALLGLRSLAPWRRPWRRPRPLGRLGPMVVLGWLVCLGLEAAFLAWALGRWPGLGASLADLSFAMALIPAVLLAPVCEELLFRGVLCEGLSRRYGNLIGIAASAALFALAHWHWLRLPGCFAFGMLTGVLQRRTGSILPCIAIHAGHNALAALGAHHLGWAETLWGLLCAGALAVLVESCRKQPSGRARPRSS